MFANTRTVAAANLKPGALITVNGARVEVTHSRKSRYPGFQTVQYRPEGDTDYSRVQSVELRRVDQVEVVS